jgi:Na+-driven multidrug efflux pump
MKSSTLLSRSQYGIYVESVNHNGEVFYNLPYIYELDRSLDEQRLLTANTTVLSTLGRTGIFAFSVCMNLLQIYNLFVAGTCRTLQSLGAIQAGTGNNEAFTFVIRKSLRFITTAMGITCLLVLIWPQVITILFGAEDAASTVECNRALRIFALSFIPFCYIYVLMIIYKLYGHHRMALFISFALSLTVIPVLWLMSKFASGAIWYSYFIAYIIEAAVIFFLHKKKNIEFQIKQSK